MDAQTRSKAQAWLQSPFDENTRQAVQNLFDTNPTELEDAFYRDLEFGTGGMRGIMGVGTNRLNKYTLGAATQGLADYINEQNPGQENAVVVAHDVRHNAAFFTEIVANVLSANGIQVYVFDGFRPTPQLSFAVRHLKATAGIVLTASHNPPEYNGYKVYWSDGGQIVPPHDSAIIAKVKATDFSSIKFDGNPAKITQLGQEIDELFTQAAAENGSIDAAGKEKLKIVFTPIHGTAVHAVPAALAKAGFTDVQVVEEQAVPSGDFPTVESPNPEEPAALAMALELANNIDADIVIGTDPDADRLGIAVRDQSGELVLLNGNQCNTVLADYCLQYRKQQGKLEATDFIGSTIVTSDIFLDLAANYGVECKVGLTGFKWIADMIHKSEGKQKFVCGGEESFGFMVGDFVRDKDSVTSIVLACEIAAHTKASGSSFFEELIRIYTQNKHYRERLISIKKVGKQGAEEITNIMKRFRENPPAEVGGEKVEWIYDYKTSVAKNQTTGEEKAISIPKSNVLIFFTENGSKIAARPSGTEPKIKFYFSVKQSLENAADYNHSVQSLEERLDRLEKDFRV